MKVLFVYNHGGVSSNLKKGLKKYYDIDSEIITNSSKGFSYPDEQLLTQRAKRFELSVLKKAWNSDIIHLNGFPFKNLDSKILFSILKMKGKRIILHLHGTDIRRKRKLIFKNLKYFDEVIYSTPDLKEYIDYAVYLPNPIDEKMFYESEIPRLLNRTMLYINKNYESYERVKDFILNDLGLFPSHQIPKYFYSEMPSLLKTYKYYFDQYTFDAISKTGLEALSCGCIVYNNFKEVKNYPIEKHYLENVTRELVKIYGSVL